MPPLSPRVITGARYVYAAGVLATLLLITGGNAARQIALPAVFVPIAFTGAFVFFLGSFTWYGAISRLSLAWTTALVIPAVPIVSLMFAILFLGELPESHEIAGITVAVCGIVILVVGTSAGRNVVPAPGSYE
jgi:drug/metabolite transporter (DMT)-like permease